MIKKKTGKTHTICTGQSLNSLLKKTKKDEGDIDTFIEDVICVMGWCKYMEAGTEVLKDLLTNVFSNIPIRWGSNGTIQKVIEFASLKVL